MKKFFALLIVFCLIGVLFICKYTHKVFFAPLEYKNPIIFEVQKGSSAQKVAQDLADVRLVVHPVFGYFAMRFWKFDKHLKAGEYLLEPKMNLKQILEELTSGKVIMHRLTLPEGLTTVQMVHLIENNEFLTGEITEDIAQGEMLPETYTFAKGETRNNIVRKAKADMQKKLEEVWQTRASDLPLKNKEELLILASIIEKETGEASERTKVASVFINRLNLSMPLQTDPTVIYALTLGKFDLNRSLTYADLRVDSPYNTYVIKGLPPTPICNPGLQSLEAAAHPKKTDYLYFVADGKGGHRFAKTFAEHNRNIKLWLQK